jgi:hypothetical protein
MTSKSTTSTAARLLLLPLLLAGALALWLMTSTSGHAATATQTQALQATVAGKTIAWGSDPTGGGCQQIMGTADFGSVVPGANATSAGFTGCVTSNASGWSVTALGTAPMSDATCIGCAGAEIPNSALFIANDPSVPNTTGGTSNCTSSTTSCSLDVSRTVLSGATSTTTSGFSYYYALAVPANQPGGTYTGGQVTFTASN